MNGYFETGKPCKRGHVAKRYRRNGSCVECARIASKDWRESSTNKESYNLYQQEYSGHNLRLLRKYLRNPNEVFFDHRSRKRKSLNDATPKWADHDEIRYMYKECLRLSDEMGMELEVDHIIPLKGRNVCGLHVPYNLKVVSHSLNRIKANKFDSKSESRILLGWLKDRGL